MATSHLHPFGTHPGGKLLQGWTRSHWVAAPLEGTCSPAWAPSQLSPPANPPTFAIRLLWIYYFKFYRENMDLLSQCPNAKSTRSHTELSCQQQQFAPGGLHEAAWGLPVKRTLRYGSSCTIDLLLSCWKRPATKWLPGNQPN